MRISVEKKERNPETIEVISSKSYVHRLLIAAAFSKAPVKIITNAVSKDMEATARCLRALGAKIETKALENRFVFEITQPVHRVEEAILDCGQSGSTARFLLPVAAVLARKATITGSGKLPERPFGPLCEALRKNGVEIDSDYLPLNVSGELIPGEYTLPGDVSSQYITGLMFALSLLNSESRIVLSSKLESESYVAMTMEVLNSFGVSVAENDKGYTISGKSDIIGPKEIYAEADWSNGGFLMCLGALNGGISLKGLRLPSTQGDSSVFDIMSSFGYEVIRTGEQVISVSGESIRGIDIDVSQIPDLVPALAAVAAFAPGKSVFRNAQRLRIKECDRIEAVSKSLELFGIKCETEIVNGRENMYVFGNGHFCLNKEICADGYDDHRIVMMLAMLSAGSEAEVIIDGAEAVNKSYPGFFEICQKIGMKVCDRG